MTGGEKNAEITDILLKQAIFSPSVSFADSSLVRGSLCALRALSPHRGDTFTNVNNNLSFHYSGLITDREQHPSVTVCRKNSVISSRATLSYTPGKSK